jgi:DNA-binding NtrC family response regulator
VSSARLLIVDDEPALLGLLLRYLEKLGYAVDSSSDPQEALEKYSADPQRYDLVITDLTFPGMNGEDMLERMREINPKLAGVISSGYPHTPRLAGVGFLQKPYLPDMLATVVEQALKSAR